MIEQASMFPDVVRKSASISECGQYRFTLRRWWREDSTVCWIMLNPSTADASVDDPTIRTIIDFTKRWGYGGLVVVNLFPFRTSSPRMCRAWADWESGGPDWWVRDLIYFRNLPLILEQAEKADLVVAAWGAAEWAWGFADHVADEVSSIADIYCLGTTKDGSPKHPLARGSHRIDKDQEPILWRAA